MLTSTTHQSSVCVLHISLSLSLCLRRTFHISHLWGFMMFRMLLLKAAVYVGSEQQASSYSLEINTNTESWDGFVFFKLYIFFSLPMDFILRVEMLCLLTSTALPRSVSRYWIHSGHRESGCSGLRRYPMGTWKCLSRKSNCVSKPSCLSSFWICDNKRKPRL